MLKVGLTGGLASGKSTVLAMFAALGAHTLRADLVAHRLMSPAEPIYHRIVDAFGTGILASDGTIVRPRLAALAFPGHIAELNAILHPAVLEFEDHWMRQVGRDHPQGVAICEAALLIEAGGLLRFDRLIVVTCTLEQKIARFAERTGLKLDEARSQVLQRMAAQMPEEEKVALASFVIRNSGSHDEAQRQVAGVWQQLDSAARQAAAKQ
jgi:dephospho-CoA kinase